MEEIIEDNIVKCFLIVLAEFTFDIKALFTFGILLKRL